MNQLEAFNPSGCIWQLNSSATPAQNALVVQAASPVLASIPLPVRVRISLEPILTTATSLDQIAAWLATHPLNSLPVGTRVVTLCDCTPPYLGPNRKGPPTDQAGWAALCQAVKGHFGYLPGDTWFECFNEPDGMAQCTVQELFDWYKLTYDALGGAYVGGLAVSNEGATGTSADPRPGADYLVREWLSWARLNNCPPAFLSHHAYGPYTVAQADGIPAVFRGWMVEVGYLQSEADLTPVILDEHNVDAGNNKDKCLGLGLARLLRTAMALHGQWQIHQTLFDTGPTDYRSGLFSRVGIAHPKWQGLRLAATMVGGTVVAYVQEAAPGQPVSILATEHPAVDGKKQWRVLVADERVGSYQTNILIPPGTVPGVVTAKVRKAHKGTLTPYGSPLFPLSNTVLGDEYLASLRIGNPTNFLSFVAGVNNGRNGPVDMDTSFNTSLGYVPVALQAPGAGLVTFTA